MTESRDPLSIAIVYDCLYPTNTGGGERVYRAIAERLVARGHRVDYLTRRQWQRDAPDAEFSVVPVWQGEIYDAAGNRRATSAARFAFALFKALLRRRTSYDIVIVSALPPLNLFAARFALLATSTWIVADWLEVWPWRKWREYSGTVVGSVAYLLQTVGLRLSDEVTANSAFTLERASAHISAGKGLVLGLVDLVDETTGDGDQEREDGLILFAGRHIPDKQLTSLPAALAVARTSHPGAHLVVVGSGPETESLRRAAEEAGVDVDIRGRVSDQELSDLMARAEALVNPSRREGFGLVVAEAASHGTPSVVVAGEDNAAAELVVDGVNGYVAASVNPDDLGEALARALEGGSALRESTTAWFDDARLTRNLGDSVDQLIDSYFSRSAR